MSLHVTAPPSTDATDSPESDTQFPIPVDGFRAKPCGCGVFVGEECDCAQFAAEARDLFAGSRTIMCRPASQWGAA